MKKTCSRGHVFEKTSACPTCPICWPKIKQKLLQRSDLPPELSAPALRALDRAGIRSLIRLAKRTEAEISGLHGVGPNAIKALKAAMRARRLAFKKG